MISGRKTSKKPKACYPRVVFDLFGLFSWSSWEVFSSNEIDWEMAKEFIKDNGLGSTLLVMRTIERDRESERVLLEANLAKILAPSAAASVGVNTLAPINNENLLNSKEGRKLRILLSKWKLTL